MCRKNCKGSKPGAIVARGSLNQVFCRVFEELKRLGLLDDSDRGRAYATWRGLPTNKATSVEALKSVLGL